MKLPKKITPCPIIDSLLEIRFKTSIPHDAVFGIVYNSFKASYKKHEPLPILQLPEPVRRTDPNLKFQPYYRISNDNFVIQIGPNVITISSFPQYVGWLNFQEEIKKFIISLNSLSIVEEVNRIGLRVVNFFSGIDIFKNSKISIKISDEKIGLINTLFRTEYSHENSIKSTLNITNNASINLKIGSIIDIDTFLEKAQTLTGDSIVTEIDRIHHLEKIIFFSLLKDEFLSQFNPEY